MQWYLNFYVYKTLDIIGLNPAVSPNQSAWDIETYIIVNLTNPIHPFRHLQGELTMNSAPCLNVYFIFDSLSDMSEMLKWRSSKGGVIFDGSWPNLQAERIIIILIHVLLYMDHLMLKNLCEIK